ncbi:ABC transporter substrate-binding protein [Pandoraea anapnoica]|uniref:ABC transporter substrate-binding protein n=2 Tax=Pandoraea TaxID=93217 RepID=A0A5E4Z8F6_9BURK|nr:MULTISPECIES: XapX domain-containing protein [Pandoraea]UVA80569.1 XapX domain-containing protein [Pandoraea commovens]VVE57088.1 ABC transporter substrate-binding protein [Pandoraea commovens]VVE71762.1 ABC transporter substrate-binding protein [Pandoraea anapnoica]
MKLYLVSLAVGVLVGIIYGGLGVRSPAPPAVALIGLLGMLIGEQVVPPVKRLLAGEPVNLVWFHRECVPKITGLPGPVAQAAKDEDKTEAPKA